MYKEGVPSKERKDIVIRISLPVCGPDVRRKDKNGRDCVVER